MNYGDVGIPKKGLYQWRCGDYVHGYCVTKQEAIDKAIEFSTKDGLAGFNGNLDWYVGIVVDIKKNTSFMNLQRGDGSGIFDCGQYTYRTAVITSTVAFGHVNISEIYEDAIKGQAQGQARM